jgi:hypothetical protein
MQVTNAFALKLRGALPGPCSGPAPKAAGCTLLALQLPSARVFLQCYVQDARNNGGLARTEKDGIVVGWEG